MRRLVAHARLAAALAVVLGLAGIGAAGAHADGASGDARYIVTFASGTSSADQAADIAAAGATDVSAIPALRMHVVDASDAAVAALTASSDVTGVDSDQLRDVQATPSDPEYPNQ